MLRSIPFMFALFYLCVNILSFLTLFHSFNKSCVDLNILHLDDVICHIKNERYRISHDLLKNLTSAFESKYTSRRWYHWSCKINWIESYLETKYSWAMYGNANAWVHWNLSFKLKWYLTIVRMPCVRTRTRWLFKSRNITCIKEKRSFINCISCCKSHAYYLQKRRKDLNRTIVCGIGHF